MKELSLNILDIAGNSVKAGATRIIIALTETDETLSIVFEDNGCGMTKEQVESVTDPFFTTRTTRNVGLGIPFLKLAAEQTGGSFSIESTPEKDSPGNHGTKTTALFYKNNIDFTPLGDVVSTVTTLIMGSPATDWLFTHTYGEKEVRMDTAEIRGVLGDDVPLDSYEVIEWIRSSLEEEYDSFYK
ncbi:MAG: sensor histidine kinase [Clostridia bacterium]|jgi:anti-sigma regulatory factor (Ser/Thr protein kinase)|nr:sensor histidine kinase [Clostridia bacterium]